MKGLRLSSAVLVALMFSACSSARPVLYPNAQLESVGKDGADRISKPAVSWRSRRARRKVVGEKEGVSRRTPQSALEPVPRVER